MGGYEAYVVFVDCDRIHDYIFATSRLWEIRGASELLAHINSEETAFQLLKGIGGQGNVGSYQEKTVADDGLDWELVYSIAGITKVVFKNFNLAEHFRKRIDQFYREQAVSLPVTTHIGSVTYDELHHNFGEAVKRGEKIVP